MGREIAVEPNEVIKIINYSGGGKRERESGREVEVEEKGMRGREDARIGEGKEKQVFVT